MDSLLLLSPSPELQNPISDPANSIVDEFKNETTMIKKKKKKSKTSNLEKRKLKGKIITNNNNNNDEASSSSCCSSFSTTSNNTKRVSRVAATHHRLRNPPVRLGMTRRSVGERQAEALALPLGMSFAAFANLVLERKSVAGQNVYVDDLAVVSASAVTESLSNVYGNKLGSFATNFERSFNSTLRILRLINESAFPQQLENNNNNLDECSDDELSIKETSSTMSAYEPIQGNTTTTTTTTANPLLMMRELVLHEDFRQLSSIFPRRNSSSMSLTTSEREQIRANDLKEIEMGLKVRKIWQTERGLALNDESNNLKKTEIDMSVTRAAFEEEKFKTEQEDKRKSDIVPKIIDWLVVNVFIMLVSMGYAVSIFSQQRITEATSICQPSPEEKSSSSWWIPKQVTSVNNGFNVLMCQVKVWVQIFFGVLMILVSTHFIIQRSSGKTQSMPVTFIVLFLGIFCGLLGKFSVDTLGGNGKLWMFLWEMFCVLQFVANVFTLALYGLIFGPINVSPPGEGVTKSRSLVPFWVRKSFFIGLVMCVLPAVNGLLPFASFVEWRDHFGLKLYEFLGASSGSDEL